MASDKKEIERKLWESKLKHQKLEREFDALNAQIGPLIERRDVILRELKAAKARVDKLEKMLAE